MNGRIQICCEDGVAVEDVPAVRGDLVFNEAPKFIRQLQRPEDLPRGIQQGIKIGLTS